MSNCKSQEAFLCVVKSAHKSMEKMYTIYGSNYTVIKLPRNGNSKAEKSRKHNSVYRRYQVQPM